MAALRTHAQAIATQVLRENDGKWESASDRDLERVNALAHAVVNRLLHHPTSRLKELRDDRVHARMAMVRDLFDLEVEEGARTITPRIARFRSPAPATSSPGFDSIRAAHALMRIGTRGSALALTQARWVALRLGSGAELVTITTAGDRAQRLADKSRWVSELEQALLDGRIEVAVHSAKDVPAELAQGLEIVAVPAREDPHDAICGAPSLDALPDGARVGTSSLRRAAQLRALRADLEVVPVRGNVDTRLRKLADGEVDALVLAMAGLRRLGREAAAGGVLAGLVPAAGQGALALEGRPGAIDGALLEALNDPQSAACLAAERALTRALRASCNTAVGAHARVAGEGLVELSGWVGMPDGSRWIADRLVGPVADVGQQVAERMRAAGAEALLAAAELEAAG